MTVLEDGGAIVLHQWMVSGLPGGGRGERAAREVRIEAKRVDGIGCVGDGEGERGIRRRGVLTTKGRGLALSL
ncbi:hypothetical protein U1Q18_040687, partial [Sarracenia purpurea var. burkii]